MRKAGFFKNLVEAYFFNMSFSAKINIYFKPYSLMKINALIFINLAMMCKYVYDEGKGKFFEILGANFLQIP